MELDLPPDVSIIADMNDKRNHNQRSNCSKTEVKRKCAMHYQDATLVTAGW
jgi:hypothetical protein